MRFSGLLSLFTLVGGLVVAEATGPVLVPDCLRPFAREIQKGAGRLPAANARRIFVAVPDMSSAEKAGVVAIMASEHGDIGFETVDAIFELARADAGAFGVSRNELLGLVGGVSRQQGDRLVFVPGVDSGPDPLLIRLARDTAPDHAFGAAGELIGARILADGDLRRVRGISQESPIPGGRTRQFDVVVDDEVCRAQLPIVGGLHGEIKHHRGGAFVVSSQLLDEFARDAALHGPTRFACLRWLLVSPGISADDLNGLRLGMVAQFESDYVRGVLQNAQQRATLAEEFQTNFASIVRVVQP